MNIAAAQAPPQPPPQYIMGPVSKPPSEISMIAYDISTINSCIEDLFAIYRSKLNSNQTDSSTATQTEIVRVFDDVSHINLKLFTSFKITLATLYTDYCTK